MMDGVAWLLVKAALLASAVCGLAGAAVQTARVLRDHLEMEDLHLEGEQP